MSQCDRIANHLKAGRAITALEALERFGCMRLAARIADLRERGWEIVSERIERNGKKFCRYRMQ